MTSTRHPRPRRLQLESFEAREVPATLTTGVDNDNYDSDLSPTDWDGTDNLLSLQEAIRMVNQGADSTIDFNGLTVQRATPTDDFPSIANYVTIRNGTLDGMTNRSGLILLAGGWVHDMTFVRCRRFRRDDLRRSGVGRGQLLWDRRQRHPGLGNDAGLWLRFDAIGGTVQNNVFSGNTGVGMDITGDDNTIWNNVVSGNGSGIAIGGGDYNWIARNKIGVAADGVTPMPNTGNGISVFGLGELRPGKDTKDIIQDLREAVGNFIGGSIPAYRNIIAGFTGAGVSLSGGAVETQVVGNYIGLTAAGTVLPGGSNGDGVRIDGSI